MNAARDAFGKRKGLVSVPGAEPGWPDSVVQRLVAPVAPAGKFDIDLIGRIGPDIGCRVVEEAENDVLILAADITFEFHFVSTEAQPADAANLSGKPAVLLLGKPQMKAPP
jgi:hypothetical protein